MASEDNENREFKVGDMLVSPKGIFEIVEKKEKETIDGEKKKYFFLEPRYGRRKDSLRVSFPVDNVDQIKMRKAVTEKELEELLGEFKDEMDEENLPGTMKLRKMANSNDPSELVDVLKSVYIYKHVLDRSSTSKNKVFKRSLRQLAQEISCVTGKSISEAKKRIRKILKKNIKPKKKEEK